MGGSTTRSSSWARRRRSRRLRHRCACNATCRGRRRRRRGPPQRRGRRGRVSARARARRQEWIRGMRASSATARCAWAPASCQANSPSSATQARWLTTASIERFMTPTGGTGIDRPMRIRTTAWSSFPGSSTRRASARVAAVRDASSLRRWIPPSCRVKVASASMSRALHVKKVATTCPTATTATCPPCSPFRSVGLAPLQGLLLSR